MENYEDLNKVELTGRVSRCITHQVGSRICAQIQMATNFMYTDTTGLAVIETTWHTVSAFTNTNKTITEETLKSIVKGTKVSVIGRIKNHKMLDSEGRERCAVEIIANSLNIVE